jgi:hypothetical protein
MIGGIFSVLDTTEEKNSVYVFDIVQVEFCRN